MIFVLWVLVILSVIAGQFCFSMKNEVDSARLIKDEAQAYYIANAGIAAGLKKIIGDETGKRAKGKDIKEEDQNLTWRVNTVIQPQSFANGTYTIDIGNESGKVNLNYASRDLLRILFSSLKLEEDQCKIIVDSILDWRDADALHRLNGAENDYYQSLFEPYKCRDGFFRYKDELLLVRGITKELYYDKGLKDFISIVISPESGKGRININAVPLRLLKILPGMTSEAVGDIVNFRKKKDITGLQNLSAILGFPLLPELGKNIGYHYNRFYTFNVEGKTDNGFAAHGIQVLIKRTKSYGLGYQIVQWIDSVP